MAWTEGLCAAIQETLNNILKDKSPLFTRTQTGYLDAVISPYNTAGVTKIPVDPGNGKIKTVRLTYFQKGCEDDIGEECMGSDCEGTDARSPKESVVEVNNCISTKGTIFDEADMRKLCEPDSAFLKQYIASELDPMMVALNRRLITVQALNFGAFVPAAAAPMQVDMMTANIPIYIGEKRVLEQFQNLGISAQPMLIGNGLLDDYTMINKVGCCNAAGVDHSRVGNYQYYRDRFVGGILGNANDFIGLAPGYVQLLTWNKNKGDYRKVNDVFSHDTFVDPKTGLEIDLDIVYNPCTSKYFMQIGFNWELWFLPTDSFQYCDENYNVNYTLHFRAI